MSEMLRHQKMVEPYCVGNGADLGSSGWPVVPWAIQVDLPMEDYLRYNANRPDSAIHWRGSATDLPFKDNVLDFLHNSHLLEDYEHWPPVLAEWDRVLKVGGFLIIAVPDHDRFRANVRRAAEKGIDVDNLSHKHESHVGELSHYLSDRYHVFFDNFVDNDPNQYSILFVGQKKAK